MSDNTHVNEIPVKVGSLFDRIQKETVMVTDGIRFFGKTFAFDLDQSEEENSRIVEEKFNEHLEHTLAVMLYQHYYLDTHVGRDVEGPNYMEIRLTPEVSYLSQIAEGALPPETLDVKSIGGYGFPVRVDIDKIRIKVLAKPVRMEIVERDNKKRYMAMVYFDLEYLD